MDVIFIFTLNPLETTKLDVIGQWFDRTRSLVSDYQKLKQFVVLSSLSKQQWNHFLKICQLVKIAVWK